MSTGLCPEQRAELIADRIGGMTIDQLCDKYRIGDTSVRNILKKANVKVGRKSTHKSRKQIIGVGRG